MMAKKAPIPVNVEIGKNYYWCSCGKSTKQPFCDGSHKKINASPIQWTPEKSGTLYFCNCKTSLNPVLCDGSHHNL